MSTPAPAAEPVAPNAGQPTAVPPTAVPPTNGLAIASLVLSLVGLGTFVTAIAGVITGHVALGQIERTGQGGRSLARAGLVIGYIVIALGTALIVLGLAGVLFYARYAVR
jgi:hypothetical protein